MISVLFLCVHNSGRSQIAEAYLRRVGKDLFLVESAGLEPGTLNPYVVEALREDGIDISGKKTQSVFDLHKHKRSYQYVITVCSRDAAERCPVFPGRHKNLHWSFPDPASFVGTELDIMAKVRIVRDAIRDQVRQFAKEVGSFQ